jgi:hypothetical protein
VRRDKPARSRECKSHTGKTQPAIPTHRVSDRLDRYEPRVKQRRRNHYGWLTAPRAEMKRKMAKGLILI